MTTLETARLTLRPLELDDASTIAGYCGNLDISRWLTVVPHPYTLEHANTFLADRVPFGNGGNFNFAITLTGSDDLVGIVALDAHEEDAKELGYWLAPHLWRQGLVSEAITPVVDRVFETNDISKLYAGCQKENTGSRTILENLGFQMTGSK